MTWRSELQSALPVAALGAVGYDLTRLLIGAEGTLGLIVEATLKLTPLSQARGLMRLAFSVVECAMRDYGAAASAFCAGTFKRSQLEFCSLNSHRVCATWMRTTFA